MASGDPGQESGEGGQRSMLCKSIAILCTLFVCNYSKLLAVSLVPVCRAFCQRLRAGRSRKPRGDPEWCWRFRGVGGIEGLWGLWGAERGASEVAAGPVQWRPGEPITVEEN